MVPTRATSRRLWRRCGARLSRRQPELPDISGTGGVLGEAEDSRSEIEGPGVSRGHSTFSYFEVRSPRPGNVVCALMTLERIAWIESQTESQFADID